MTNDYTLLRQLDPKTVKSGDEILDAYGSSLNFIAGPDAEGDIVVSGTAGTFRLMLLSRARITPITWIEGKPVYKGDVLYYIVDKQYAMVVSHLQSKCQVWNDQLTWVHTTDLTWVKAPVRKEGWINIYPNNRTHPEIFQTREDADKSAYTTRIDCISINWKE